MNTETGAKNLYAFICNLDNNQMKGAFLAVASTKDEAALSLYDYLKEQLDAYAYFWLDAISDIREFPLEAILFFDGNLTNVHEMLESVRA
mgnify:CR=1 FL=1